MTRFVIAIASLFMSLSVMAAPTTYEFDTVTTVNVHTSLPSITGILTNATTPTTVTFVDNVNAESRWPVTRCIPVFLLALEKPGRYVSATDGRSGGFEQSVERLRLSVEGIASGLGLGVGFNGAL